MSLVRSKSLLVTGLTAALLVCCAGSAAARRLSLKDTMRRVHGASLRSRAKSLPVRRAKVGRALRSTRTRVVVPVRVRVRRGYAAHAGHALSSPGGVVSQSMLRWPGAASDLNPMPQLLDLDDRARDMRESTRKLHRMSGQP